MDKNSKDPLGDTLKAVEQEEAGRKASLDRPLMARLDGRAFSTFTKNLKRPYDLGLSSLMIQTASHLVKEFGARVGYTQSDEITIAWSKPEEGGEFLFGGKFQKLTSLLAASATGFFNNSLHAQIPEKVGTLPTFDCRVWQPTNMTEAYLNFVWRQDDAIKNSISMAAQAHFSHKELHQISSGEKQKMLRECGDPWEDMPAFFKWGTFVKSSNITRELTAEEMELIPEKNRPHGPVIRRIVSVLDIKPLRNTQSPQETLFSKD